MSQIYTFHETVRGHLHIMNEFPCEDSSASFSAEDGTYHIAAVADGHGSSSCFRSDYGSKTAVDVAMECLRQFAEAYFPLEPAEDTGTEPAPESEEADGAEPTPESVEDKFYQDMFSDPRYQKMTLKQLTDTIVAGWHDRVMKHYESNPPSVEEMGENAEECEDPKKRPHIYGTTLMAALWLPKCLILIHQGDGRCDVFYEDGSVDQPIPWDDRCEDTTTTSLCDEDVSNSFRSCAINLEQKPVMACYLGCDGVEDAYRDTYEALGGSHSLMGGVHTFYKNLTCRLAKMGPTEFENYLKTTLPDFSANGLFSRSGSGDDVSVAGIVDLDRIPRYVAQYKYEVNRYALEEDLFWKEDELRGKKRKHDILRDRVKKAQAALDEAQKALGKHAENIRELETTLEEARSAFEEYDAKYQAIDADRIRIEEKIAALQAGNTE